MNEQENIEKCRGIIDYLKAVSEVKEPILIFEQGLETLTQKGAKRQIATMLDDLVDWANHLEPKDRIAINRLMLARGHQPFLNEQADRSDK